VQHLRGAGVTGHGGVDPAHLCSCARAACGWGLQMYVITSCLLACSYCTADGVEFLSTCQLASKNNPTPLTNHPQCTSSIVPLRVSYTQPVILASFLTYGHFCRYSTSSFTDASSLPVIGMNGM